MPRTTSLTDRAWLGYHPRAAAPHLAAAAAASAGLLGGRWAVEDLSGFAERTGAFVVYATVAAVWATCLAAVLYRAVTYTYRLTDRELLVDRGPLFRPEPPIRLADVTAAVAETSHLGRRLGVGRVRVTTAAGRVVRLPGVADPGRFAAAVRAGSAEASRV